MYHAFETIILHVLYTEPKNAPKAVIVMCFHPLTLKYKKHKIINIV
jgi:hypothetical protein